MMRFAKLAVAAMAALVPVASMAWRGMPMPELRVEGRYLVDTHGNPVNLHGFAQTYSPWFNEMGSKWTNYDVRACLRYNQDLIDKILAAGWDVNFLRLHMDPYWSNTPGVHVNGEADISAFDMSRFEKYLDKVFVPMAEYAVEHGLYVVMRPPGVCPEEIAVGDAYQKYLISVWTKVAQHEVLRNHPNIMFELANEPVRIKGTDGVMGGNGQACFDALHDYFQPVVDAMRAQGARNILWVPGLGYQANYSGFANNPIEGENIGYAVHIYPGWFGSNSAEGYKAFRAGWDKDIKPVADFAPIMITEMDWAPEKYNSSWGKGVTGDESHGFGANFMRLCEESGNASWLLFTGPDLMAQFVDNPGKGDTFLTDPEACPWAVYHRYQQYREEHQYPWPEFKNSFSGVIDDEDGTFMNPVVYTDLPDIDVTTDGDAYYMLSTTKSMTPGATILRSYDLLNWEYCANPLVGANMEASALQWHDGTFYLLLNTSSDSYLMTADDVNGPWTTRKLSQLFPGAGILFDGDDIYVSYWDSKEGRLPACIARVDKDFNVKETHEVTVQDGAGWQPALLGSPLRLYHNDPYYYIYTGSEGQQYALRSSSIFGDYEEHLIFDEEDDIALCNGALFETPDGQLWTMLGYDEHPLSQSPYLLPMEIRNGWPTLAMSAEDIESPEMPKIVSNHPTPRIETNDAFRHYLLGDQWQWYGTPDPKSWSLTQCAGYMRLYAKDGSLPACGNVLTQRIHCDFANMTRSYGTIAMDVTNMREGEFAGIAALQDDYSCIGVKVIDGKRVVCIGEGADSSLKEIAEISADIVYLRASVSFIDPVVTYFYSTDNKTYTQAGEPIALDYGEDFGLATRFALFNNGNNSGWVDIDWFSTEPSYTEDTYLADNFEGYTEESLTVESLTVGADEVVLLTGSCRAVEVLAVFADGHKENVAAKVTYTVGDEDVVEINRGSFRALADGRTPLHITYRGPLGHEVSLDVMVECSTFPLVKGLFNPSIYGEGSFVQKTHRVTTGQYGFAGWYYQDGISLDDYKYIVAKVAKSPQAGGLSFRLFDENSYWAGCAAIDKQSATDYDYFVADLHNTWKDDKSRKINPSHLYYIGFWTVGGSFTLNTVYVTNDDDYLKEPTGIADILIDADPLVDVYTLEGMLLYQSISRAEALSRLPSGFYIIGNQKVLIAK